VPLSHHWPDDLSLPPVFYPQVEQPVALLGGRRAQHISGHGHAADLHAPLSDRYVRGGLLCALYYAVVFPARHTCLLLSSSTRSVICLQCIAVRATPHFVILLIMKSRTHSRSNKDVRVGCAWKAPLELWF
jgi:hypothetical protein